jgi:hypothetical protein
MVRVIPRPRLVAAADHERRGMVRDLHDGAQQRLVHSRLSVLDGLRIERPADGGPLPAPRSRSAGPSRSMADRPHERPTLNSRRLERRRARVAGAARALIREGFVVERSTARGHAGPRLGHQVESKVPGRGTGGISRTVGRV